MSFTPAGAPGPLIASGTLLAGSGELTMPRASAFFGGITPTLGQLLLAYFNAQRTETVGHVATETGGTAAAGLTTAAIGAYSVDALGNLTLLASVSDLTLWTGTFTLYTRAWSVAWPKTAGLTYAIGVLAAGTTPPALSGSAVTGNFANQAPLMCAIGGTGLSSLPASVAAGSLTSAGGKMLLASVTP